MHPPPFSMWLKMQASAKRLLQNCCAPPFSMDNIFCPPPFRRGKNCTCQAPLPFCRLAPRLLFFVVSNLEKYGKFWKKRPFFRADMARLGKYSMGGYGRIGVYRVKKRLCPMSLYCYPPCRLSPSPMSHISNGHVSLWILGVKGHVISSFNSSSLPQTLSTAPSHLQVLPIPLPFWPLPILLTGLATFLATFSCGRMFQLVQALQATYTL